MKNGLNNMEANAQQAVLDEAHKQIAEMKAAIKETQQSLIDQFGYRVTMVNFAKLMNIKT